MRNKLSFLIVVLFLLTSCYMGVPLREEKADNNRTYEVDYLFEHDGCKVYRFYDMGNYVYFTNCRGEVTAIENDSTETRVVNHIREFYPEGF